MNNLLRLPIGRDRPRKSQLTKPSAVHVVPLFESRAYALAQLRNAMNAEPLPSHPLLRFPIRKFRQRLCRIMREFSGLSREELCALLNDHPEVCALQELPGAYLFLPVTTEFLESLEENINAIIEYNPYGGGFLGIGAYGAPTDTFARAIAEICGHRRDYYRFDDWSLECSRRELERNYL